jgi:hypothetical protein
MILCIGGVSASQNTTDLGIDDGEIALESENIDEISHENNEIISDSNSTDTNTDSSAPTNTQAQTTKTAAYGLATTDFIKKENKNVKIGVCTFNEAKNKLDFHKNVKVTVKVKIGKKTKVYNVKTNSKGIAKVFNVKNLKTGAYKIMITSNDDKYTIKESGYINIYKKKAKTITLKMNKRKKVKGDYIENFYIDKTGQYAKGVYAESYNAKKPLDGNPHTLVVKAKFFFKNKKTGKIKTKTVKTKDNPKYLVKDLPYAKLIKGYKPIKTKIWYVTR